jgi:chaperone modulatory protein CbpM
MAGFSRSATTIACVSTSLDVARVHLICELRYELRIEEDSMSVVLSLMDQLYQARRSLRTLLSALEAEPEEVRARIATHFETER